MSILGKFSKIDDLARFAGKGADISDATKLTKFLDDADNLGFLDDLKKNFKNADGSLPEIKFGDLPGEIKIGNKKINFKDIQENIGTRPKTNGTVKPNTIESYKALGFSDDVLKSDKGVMDFFKSVDDGVEAKWKSTNNTIEKGNPTKIKDVDAQKITDTPGQSAAADDLKSKINDPANKSKGYIETTGKWLSRIAIPLVATGLAISVSETVENYRKAANGCWLVNVKDPQIKLKVKPLTCDPDSLKQSELYDFKFAESCENQISCANNTFNPMLLQSSDITPMPIIRNLSLPVPGKYVNDNGGSCANYTGCVKSCASVEESDNDNGCLKCSCDNFTCKEGYMLYCKNMDFATAFYDMTGEALASNELFAAIINILKYVGYIIVSIFGLLLLVRLFILVKSLFPSNGNISNTNISNEDSSFEHINSSELAELLPKNTIESVPTPAQIPTPTKKGKSKKGKSKK